MRINIKRLIMSCFAISLISLIISDIRNTLKALNDESILKHIILDIVKNKNTSKANSLLVRFANAFRKTNDFANDNPSVKIWSSGINETEDRIDNQMNYIPPNYNTSSKQLPLVIYEITGLQGKPGTYRFQNCKVKQCFLTDNPSWKKRADAVLYHNGLVNPDFNKPSHQVWIYFMLESAFHTPPMDLFYNKFNWTATFRIDSQIVTPYGRYALSDSKKTGTESKFTENILQNKSKSVAWFVSNCAPINARRLYSEELSKYIDVDVYGNCGNLKCSRTKGNNCFKLLSKEYKFYLSFENSNCRDYITEKFFHNALRNNIIPIVMGAPKEDYIRVAPLHSFIHVDDFASPKHLANYLKMLSQNTNLYNSYFEWKKYYKIVDTNFYCRLCALLHDRSRNVWYEDIQRWWNDLDNCIVPSKYNPWGSWKIENKFRKQHAKYDIKYDDLKQTLNYDR